LKTLLFILVGLLPAVAIRFALMRRRVAIGPAIGVCLGVLLVSAIVVTSRVQKRFASTGEEQTMGPIPILVEFVAGMFKVALPVTALSFFILRTGSRE
jgi:hypothetical protein